MSTTPTALPFATRDALKALASDAKSKPRTIEFVTAPGADLELGILKLRAGELEDVYEFARKMVARDKRLGVKRRLGFRAFLLARTLVTKDGARLLTDEDATSGWLDDLDADLCSLLIKTAFRLNGVGREEEREESEDEDETGPAVEAGGPPAPSDSRDPR